MSVPVDEIRLTEMGELGLPEFPAATFRLNILESADDYGSTD